MTTEVKAWMSGDPVCVGPGAPAREALARMVERGVRHLPVVDAGHRVLGALSIEDLRAAPPSAAAGELMRREPATVREEADLADAVERMLERRIGCLPVVDAEGRLAGLLSESDLLRALATMLWAERVRRERARDGELAVRVEAPRDAGDPARGPCARRLET